MSFPKIEGYVVTEKLGSGSYSTVYKAYTKVRLITLFTDLISCNKYFLTFHSPSLI